MTSTGVAPGRLDAVAGPDRHLDVWRNVLLACGVVAPLIYAAADVLGGMRYEGYSFNAQAVSELMATGAPTEAFVDPLFMVFNALVLAFAILVVREGDGSRRALRIAGFALVMYALLGFTGPTLFEMHPRESKGVNDMPHIVLTAIIVVCQLLAIAASGLAFGRRFRAYAFATIVAVLAFGALASINGPKIAAGEPTPWFGVLERMCIYTSLLWFPVFAIRLARRPGETA